MYTSAERATRRTLSPTTTARRRWAHRNRSFIGMPLLVQADSNPSADRTAMTAAPGMCYALRRIADLDDRDRPGPAARGRVPASRVAEPTRPVTKISDRPGGWRSHGSPTTPGLIRPRMVRWRRGGPGGQRAPVRGARRSPVRLESSATTPGLPRNRPPHREKRLCAPPPRSCLPRIPLRRCPRRR